MSKQYEGSKQSHVLTSRDGGPEFHSKFSFAETDIPARLAAIHWFSHSGEPVSLELTMEARQAKTWERAMQSCKKQSWKNAQLEAQNQLTSFLSLHHREQYRAWNRLVEAHKLQTIEPLTKEHIIPFQQKNNLDSAFIHSVRWDILGALMANSYLYCQHSSFFFLEILKVYEAGHFPCGWQGKWPLGDLIIY
jgi:coproporphyrinogen III oxidase-like Fe-S oxidoreductase